MAHTPTLKHVSETMLWTLHNRAVEAMRADGILHDPKAVNIYQSIDYDYQKNFGKAEPSHAIRSKDFDTAIRDFLQRYPTGTIVNLGEGLETQRFRIPTSQSLWLSVDLPEAIAIREQFIEADEQHQHLAVSALDTRWFAAVPPHQPVFISAQGLFMYFSEQEVKTLLQAIANHFERWCVMFDTIPNWIANKTCSESGWAKTPHYTTPKMPWGINRNQIKPVLKNWLGANATINDLGYSTFPRGAVKWFFWLLCHTPGIKNATPSIVKISHQLKLS